MSNEQLNPEDYNAPLIRDLDLTADETAPVTPDNPPWSVPIAFVVWIASVLAIVIFPAIALVGYIAVTGKTQAEDIQRDQTAILLNVAAVIPAHLATLALAWFVVTAKGRYSLSQTLGLETGGFRWWHYIAVMAAFFGAAMIVGALIPEGDNAMMRMLRNSRSATYMIAFLATFTAPAVEEIVYRGVLYSALQRSVGVPGAVAITTFVFALVHVPQYWGSPGTIILLLMLSLVLTMIRVRTKNLWPCIVMHTVFNGLQSIALLAGYTN